MGWEINLLNIKSISAGFLDTHVLNGLIYPICQTDERVIILLVYSKPSD